MQPDYEKYRPYLKRFDLTDEEKDEFILALWRMLEQIADQAFGVHPLQQVVDNQPGGDSSTAPLCIEFRDKNKKE